MNQNNNQSGQNYTQHQEVKAALENNGNTIQQNILNQVAERQAANPPKHMIVATRKDERRNITHVKLEDGTQYTLDEAVRAAEEGGLANVLIGHNKFGEPYLRNIPDGDKWNNLDELPEF